jgi:phosphoglycolate phosphatase
MNLAQVDAVIFDFDGTLAPNLDLPDMRQQVIDFTATQQIPENVYAGRYIVEIIDAAHAWLNKHAPQRAAYYHQTAHDLITNFELEAARDTRPFPGITEKLDTLRATGYRLGVVTRNCRAAVLQVFPDILDYIDAIHARDDTTHLKPDPRHLLQNLNALACPPQRAAMVGDGALDMHAGRQLNMYCVGVLSGSADASALIAAGADVVVESALALAWK